MNIKFSKLLLIFFIMIIIPLYNSLNLYSAEEIFPDAEEIIRKNLEAICGKDACKNIRTQKIETTVLMVEYDFNIKTTTYREKPDKDLTIVDGGIVIKYITGSDGEMAWEIDRDKGPRIYKGNKLSEALLDGSFELEPDYWKKMYTSVRTIGIEDVNGRDCYKVVFTPYTGFKRIRYYEKESYLIIKEEKNTEIDKSIFKEERFFEDFEDYDRFLFPKTTKQYFSGKPLITTTVTINRIKNNIEVPAGIFDLPEEIKVLLKK